MADDRSPDTGALLRETLRLYRANALLVIGVVALLNVPLQLITLALNLTAPRIPPFTVSVLLNLPSTRGSTVALAHPLTAQHIAAFASIGARAVVGFVLSALVGTLTPAALAVVGARRRARRAVSVVAAYHAVLERLGALLVAFLWAAGRFIVLFLLCPTVVGLVLFIYFLVAWALIPQVVMLEGSSGGAASKRSRRLVKGRWRRTSNLFVVVVAPARRPHAAVARTPWYPDRPVSPTSRRGGDHDVVCRPQGARQRSCCFTNRRSGTCHGTGALVVRRAGLYWKRGHSDQHGRQRPRARQHLHRAALAHRQV